MVLVVVLVVLVVVLVVLVVVLVFLVRTPGGPPKILGKPKKKSRIS